MKRIFVVTVLFIFLSSQVLAWGDKEVIEALKKENLTLKGRVKELEDFDKVILKELPKLKEKLSQLKNAQTETDRKIEEFRFLSKGDVLRLIRKHAVELDGINFRRVKADIFQLQRPELTSEKSLSLAVDFQIEISKGNGPEIRKKGAIIADIAAQKTLARFIDTEANSMAIILPLDEDIDDRKIALARRCLLYRQSSLKFLPSKDLEYMKKKWFPLLDLDNDAGVAEFKNVLTRTLTAIPKDEWPKGVKYDISEVVNFLTTGMK